MERETRRDWKEALVFELVHPRYKKLAEYEDLEEQGLLVRLPCKVGDVVYEVDAPQYGVIECKVIGFTIMNEISFLVSVINGHGMGSGYEFSEGDIGKLVFLTGEEAEQKLAELEGSKDEVN